MNASRRYEILLPLNFNDGRAIPREGIIAALLELEERFGAVSCETRIIHGIWKHQGERFRDDLVRVWVDAPDLPEHRRFFAEFKERLKSDFKQLDIWMTTYPIDVI